MRPGDEVEAEGLGRLVNHIVEGSAGVRGDVGAQPTESEEVRSTALDGDWEFRGIRPPHRVSAGEARLHLAKVSQPLWV